MHDATFAPVIMRFATAYGHSYRPRFDLAVNIMTAKAVTDGQITIHGGDQWRPFVHVDDIARALILALEAPIEKVSGETFNVGSDAQNHQLKEVGEIIQRLIPRAAVLTNDMVVDKRNYYVRFTKIRETLGFPPIHTLEESIMEMKEALRVWRRDGLPGPLYNNHHYSEPDRRAMSRRSRAHPTADRRVMIDTMRQLMALRSTTEWVWNGTSDRFCHVVAENGERAVVVEAMPGTKQTHLSLAAPHVRPRADATSRTHSRRTGSRRSARMWTPSSASSAR